MLSNTIPQDIHPETTTSLKESKNSNDTNGPYSPKTQAEDLQNLKEDMDDLISFLRSNLERDIEHVKNKLNDKDLQNRLQNLYDFIEEARASFNNNSSHEQLKKILCDIVEKFRSNLKCDSKPFKFISEFYWRALADANRMAAYFTKQPNAPKNYELCKTSFFKLNSMMLNLNCGGQSIPKEIHYHWYGKALPTRYFQNIMLARRFAPDFKLRIFTNNPKHLFDNAHAEIAGGIDNLDAMLTVSTLSELLNEAKKFFTPLAILWMERIIRDESNGLLNYAALADLTRLLALYIYGGIYFDTDVVPTAEIKLSDVQGQTGLFSAENNNNVLVASPQNSNVKECIEEFINTYIRMTRTKAQYCGSEFDWMEFNSLFDYREGAKFSSHPHLSLLDIKRAPFKICPDSWLSRREIAIGVGADRIHGSTKLEVIKDKVPSWVNKDLKGESRTKIKFGGIFPFCDQTWLDKSEDNSVSSTELKAHQRKSGIGSRRSSI